MEGIIPMVSLLSVVAISFLVIRIGTAALVYTGLSRDLAKFQAGTAFLGVGFTTSESEQVIGHPVRRRIIAMMMLLGNAGFIAAISSILPVFITADQGGAEFLTRILFLSSGLMVLWAISLSKWLDRRMEQAIEWALRRWTTLDIWDYQGLLHLSEGYSVCELTVHEDDWIAGKTLMQGQLGDEGVQVLGIRRVSGEYVGVPIGSTRVSAGDVLVVYGKSDQVTELEARPNDARGDEKHKERVEELRRTLVLQQTVEMQSLRAQMTDSGTGSERKKDR
ncbi:MAG: hypothetical protein QG656_312 [Candidatus Hydrogenedentes bacterium]|nr:hypothetical protein [Candidatus Hydrogenedentota bacterium]